MYKTLFPLGRLIIGIVIIIFAISIFAVSITASITVLAYAEQQQQQQQDVITIIPGANDKNNPAFFDVT
jgi:hypothetical protein